MVYHPKFLRFLSVSQIIVGSISVLLGVVSAVLLTDFTSYAGFGIWVGIWILVAGLLGFFGSRDPQVPGQYLLGTFVGFTITACVFAGMMLICYSIALALLADCIREGSELDQYHSYYCSHLSHSSLQAGIAIDSVMLIISILEFAVGLVSSIYCCNAIWPFYNDTSRMQIN